MTRKQLRFIAKPGLIAKLDQIGNEFVITKGKGGTELSELIWFDNETEALREFNLIQ